MPLPRRAHPKLLPALRADPVGRLIYGARTFKYCKQSGTSGNASRYDVRLVAIRRSETASARRLAQRTEAVLSFRC